MPQNTSTSSGSTNNIQQLITLAKADGGKFFVIDEAGQPVLVIMGIDDYEQVLLKKVQNQAADIEEANRLIMDAARREHTHQQEQDQLKSEIIDSSFDFEARGVQGDY